MNFFKIVLDDKYLMTINFIVVFYIYNQFLKTFLMVNSRLYDFILDVILISLFSYLSMIVTIILIIILIYILYINDKNLHSFSFFNKLEAVSIAIEDIERFKTINEIQVEVEQILLEKFKQ